MIVLNLFGDRSPFVFFAAVNRVWMGDSLQRSVRWNGDDVEAIDLVKFFRFSHRGTGHTTDFFVELEVILKRNGRERLRFLFDLHAFFGFDSLMQTVAPLTTIHQAAGEFVDDHNRAFFDDVVHVQFVQTVRFQCVVDHVRPVHIAGRVETLNTR